MDYISKTEYYLMLKNQLGLIQELEWSDELPVNKFSYNKQGIMLLLDEAKKFIYVSATKDYSRRLAELFERENTNGRFNKVAFVKVADIDDHDKRFADRSNFKNFISMIDTPVEELVNVLDDHDPRIIARNRSIERIVNGK